MENPGDLSSRVFSLCRSRQLDEDPSQETVMEADVTDISPDVERMLVEIKGRMPASKRLALVNDLIHATRTLALEVRGAIRTPPTTCGACSHDGCGQARPSTAR
jgi:hypothetical protein